MIVTLAPSIAALSRAGIPANAVVAASMAFGDGIMRFKQAFSCDADIGDRTEQAFDRSGICYDPNVRPSQDAFAGTSASCATRSPPLRRRGSPPDRYQRNQTEQANHCQVISRREIADEGDAAERGHDHRSHATK